MSKILRGIICVLPSNVTRKCRRHIAVELFTVPINRYSVYQEIVVTGRMRLQVLEVVRHGWIGSLPTFILVSCRANGDTEKPSTTFFRQPGPRRESLHGRVANVHARIRGWLLSAE